MKTKTKTAKIIVYPLRGKSVGLSALIEYRGSTIWNHTGADVPRGHMVENAKHAAKFEGFTHAKIHHEYRDHPASGGARVAL